MGKGCVYVSFQVKGERSASLLNEDQYLLLRK